MALEQHAKGKAIVIAKHRSDGDDYFAEIPADYTRLPYHLQLYVTSAKTGETGISPGLAADLSNQPYLIALQA